MRESSKAALGGIIAALSVSMMLLTYLSPLLVYTAPVLAGLLLLIIVNEIGYRWAIGTYAAIGMLSVFMVADKEAAVFFVMLLGYYPILKAYVQSFVKNRVILTLIKLVIFNAALFLSVVICNYIFHIDYTELTQGGKLFVAFFAVLMNLVLFLYDYLIDKLTFLYKNRIQKKIRSLFK